VSGPRWIGDPTPTGPLPRSAPRGPFTRGVEPETWAGVLAHLLGWADAHLVATVEVEAPDAVKARLEDQARYPHSKGPLRLALPQLVGWPVAGLQERALRTVVAMLGPGAHPRQRQGAREGDSEAVTEARAEQAGVVGQHGHRRPTIQSPLPIPHPPVQPGIA